MDNFREIPYESHIIGAHSGAVLKSLLSATKKEGTTITLMCSCLSRRITIQMHFFFENRKIINEHTAAIC